VRPLQFYEVVKVLDTPRTRELGIANRTGSSAASHHVSSVLNPTQGTAMQRRSNTA